MARTPPNAGAAWTCEADNDVKYLYDNKESLESICLRMGRSPGSIVARLKRLGKIDYHSTNDVYYDVNTLKTWVRRTDAQDLMPDYWSHTTVTGRMSSSEDLSQQLPKEQEMNENKPAVEQVTRIYDRDAADISDDTLISYITKLEGEIAALEKITVRSKKITAIIVKKREDLQHIVDVLDSRL